ncbi:MAG: hypothetical protein EAZ32_04630 [Cytophagia bacterium]|nr:MAG: hypothetical protein EAZ38_03485 [Cytophagales bacterium]TAG40951.1 MAG: hypothetical protein EAZ32_04630 [Cytophagia bacterium]
MDLAKKCINTGKDKNSTQKTKARAWEMCRQLLSEAERDLNVAYENTESAVDKTYLNKDFDFLRRMKENSRKPR